MDEEIWDIGDLLGQARSRSPLARADFDVSVVREANLIVEADPEPHPRHINLCSWPVSKDEQKAIALLLCARSVLLVRHD